MMRSPFHKRDRVIVSGHGRTRHWLKTMVGTVTSARGGAVFVRWDGTTFEDEMDPKELRPLPLADILRSKTCATVLEVLKVYDVATISDVAATAKLSLQRARTIMQALLNLRYIVEVIPGKFRLTEQHRTPKGPVTISHR